MEQATLGKYTVNYDIDSLVEMYKKRWLLEWVKDNHPEKIIEAERIIRSLLEEEDGSE